MTSCASRNDARDRPRDYPFRAREMDRPEAITSSASATSASGGDPEGIDRPACRSTPRASSIDSVGGRTCRPGSVSISSCSRRRRLLAGQREEPDAQRNLRDVWLTADRWRSTCGAGRRRSATIELGRNSTSSTSTTVAPGRAVLAANAWSLVRELEKFARESLDAHGYQEIATPLLVTRTVEQSGTLGALIRTTCSRSRSRRDLQPQADETAGVDVRLSSRAPLLP